MKTEHKALLIVLAALFHHARVSRQGDGASVVGSFAEAEEFLLEAKARGISTEDLLR